MRLRPLLPFALALTACNAFSDPVGSGGDPGSAPQPALVSPGTGFGTVSAGASIGVAGSGAVDPAIASVSSDVPPPPIQGGTLLVAADGHTAVVGDPDRDRVVVVDLETQEILSTTTQDAPGRMAEDSAGRVHIVLRRAGAIATLDLATRAFVDRREVCLAPEGIAYQPASDALLVACGEGKLVELPAAGGASTRSVQLDSDLRDVLVSNGRVLVSRFKSAELLELDADLQPVKRARPGEIAGPFFSAFMAPVQADLKPTSFAADVAFRTVAGPNGRIYMLHERAQSTPIALQAVADAHGDPNSAGAPAPMQLPGGDGSGSAYGGGGDLCASIVRPALSMTSTDDIDTLSSGPVLPAATLAVDAAVSPDGKWLAVGVAGSRNIEKFTFGQMNEVSAMLVAADTMVATGEGQTGQCSTPGVDVEGTMFSNGPVVAVAFDGKGRLVMQSREPSALYIADLNGCPTCGVAVTSMALGGASRADTGHYLFHNDAGAGVACASCHPGGGDDGHTWVFSDLGPRRTQLFNMGISKTLPLHWDGELATFNDLVTEVFERRMGGPILSSGQVQLLGSWIETLEPGVPLRAASDEAAVRGKALFESEGVGCANCHSGELLTNNQTVDVGTGGHFQVPSLIGVAHHAPWIHTGCASTLRERFDPTCGGGDMHGHTSQLADAELDDLVAYLESL